MQVLRAQGMVSKFQDVTLEIDRSLNSLPLVSLRVSDHIRSQVCCFKSNIATVTAFIFAFPVIVSK